MIYLYSAHRAVIFAIAQLSCYFGEAFFIIHNTVCAAAYSSATCSPSAVQRQNWMSWILTWPAATLQTTSWPSGGTTRQCGHRPKLSAVVRCILAIPATDTSSERVFSLADGGTVEERQTQLSADAVDVDI